MKNLYAKKKIYLYIILSIAISLIITTLYVFYNIIPALYKNEEIVNQNKIQTVEKNIEDYLDDKIRQNEYLSNLISDVKDINALKQELNKLINTYKYSEGVLVINDDFSYGNIELENKYLNNISNHHKTNIIETYNNDNFEAYIVTSSKVLNEDGFVITKIDRQAINKFINNLDGLSNITGINGEIILQNNLEYQVSNKELNEIYLKYQTLNTSFIEHNDKIALIGNVDFNNKLLGQWNIINIISKKDFYSSSNALIYNILGGLGGLIGLFSIIFLFFGSKVEKSFNKIVQWVKSIEDSNFDVKILPNGLLCEINNSLNNMAESIKNNFEKYKIQTEELSEKNWEIEEANKELEISYQKLQETINQLNEAEEKYYTLVKNLPEIICVIELDGTITFVNNAVNDILGYTKEELIENNISIIFSEDLTKKLLNIMNKKLRRQRKIVLETPILRKDGKEIIVEIKLTYHFRNGDVDGVQAIVRDVTKNRSLQNEIIHKNKEILTIYNISKSLSSTIEINNVFNLIVKEVCKIFNVNYCVLRIFDNSKKKLVLRAYTGKFFDGISENQMLKYSHYDTTFLQDVVKSKKIIQTEELDPNWLTTDINKVKSDSERVTNVITIPICSKHEVLGIITIGTREKIPHKNVNILMSVANNAAVAIENATLYENSKKYFLKTIDALIAAVDAKDKYTQGHSRRVSRYSEVIARELNLPNHIIEDLKIAGILHDIGKIGISDNILLKPGKLTDEEYEEIKQHPIISNRILYSVGLSDTTLKAISCHHERFDGKGYPFGLIGEDLNIECQIIAVADAFDAMTSTRSYREALSIERAIEEIVINKGMQFGPMVVDAIIKIYNQNPDLLKEISKVTDLAS